MIAERISDPVFLLSEQYLATVQISPSFCHSCREPVKKTVVVKNLSALPLDRDGVSPRLHPGQTGNLVTSDSDDA
jgi:hypothetical protein